MKKVLYVAAIILACTFLTGFRGQAIVFIEGKVVDSNTKMGVGDVQVTFWDLVDNRRYDVKTDSKGIWKWSLDIDGGKFEDHYLYSSKPEIWKIEYRKEGFTFSNASKSKTTLRESHLTNYVPPTYLRAYDITAYVEATQVYNPNPIPNPNTATIPSGPIVTVTIQGYDRVPLEMRLIPAGTFMMGSPVGETDRGDDEGPQHQVTITNPFYIGVYEVTHEQWMAVMGTSPSSFGYDAKYPVESVSWEDCQSFIAKLNTMGLGTFRLPTEAEWEYACRAGSTTRFPWGDDPGYVRLGEYAWYDASSNSTMHTVGQKKPNAWGLYDMHGNVFEWCSDWYSESYAAGAQTDPKGAGSGTSRVIRGGGWYYYPQHCRSANRGGSKPSNTSSSVGFRLVRAF